MTDKQQEILKAPELSPSIGDAVAPVVQNSDSDKSPQKEPDKLVCPEPKVTPTISKGEETFNWATYTGLNYWVNLISSVAIADYFLNPESGGRAKLNKAVSAVTKIVNKAGLPLKKAHHHSKNILETLTLLSGGLLLLIPLKLMEDNKRPIVHKLNKKLGIEQKTSDGREETPDEIHIEKEQPPQSWGRVIWRRLLATISVITVGMGLDHFARDKNQKLPSEPHDLGWAKVTHDEKVLGGQKRITDKVFNVLDHGAKVFRGKHFAPNGIVSRWTKLAILDSVFTVITAVVMKVTSRAKKAKMPNEMDDSNDPKVLKHSVNEIITTDDVEKNHQRFSERLEKRVNEIIDSKRSKTLLGHSFADSVQPKDAVSAGAGIYSP